MIFGILMEDLIFVFKQGLLMIIVNGNSSLRPKVFDLTERLNVCVPASSSFSVFTLICLYIGSYFMKF